VNNLRRLVILMVAVAALVACARLGSPTADTAADKSAIDAVEAAWYKGYNAGDGAAVTAVYAEDAVLNVPGLPALRGKASIGDFYAKDAPAFVSAGHSESDGPISEVGVSGDLAWRWGTYQVVDKSGATVDTGKYITVFQRKDGKWMILRDIWNSDAPAAPGTPPASSN